MTDDRTKGVCHSKGCDSALAYDHIPIWKELKLFGRTWIFGWWGDQIVDTVCWQCRADRDYDHQAQMLEGAYNQGVQDGYKEAQQ